jgi:hypothetical protein
VFSPHVLELLIIGSSLRWLIIKTIKM